MPESILPQLDLFPDSDDQNKIRGKDGYVAVRDISKTIGKRFNDWTRTKMAFGFLENLSDTLGLPQKGSYNSGSLIEYERGAGNGVWVHPEVAVEYTRFVERAYQKSDWLYIIHMAGTDFYKVGVTLNVESRRLQLQAGNPIKLVIAFNIQLEDARQKEAFLHQRLKKYLVHGEWFKIDLETIKSHL